MNHTARLIYTLTILSCSWLIPQTGNAQESMSPEQIEEAKNRFNKAIEQRVIKVLESIEITEEQLKPMQEALVQFFAPVQIEQTKMQAERQKMQAEGGRPANIDRQAMMQRRQKLEKLRSDLNKKVKGILDKKQNKSFQAAMEKIMPQQRRGPGGSGGGRGGR